MEFREDFQNFSALINSGADKSEIKKQYIALVKKYHPDSAPDEKKQIYNDYMILINKVYSQGKTEVKEIKIDTQNDSVQSSSRQKKVYSFKDWYGREKKYTDYLEYIMHLGITEYDAGLMTVRWGSTEELFDHTFSVKDDYKHVYEAMQHLYNASRCFSYILKNHKDYVFYTYVQELFNKVTGLNNGLSRTLAESCTRELFLT